MLGIIIGVMAVIVIVGLGNGMTQSMRDSFSALGTNALSIQVWGYGSRTASVEDADRIIVMNGGRIDAVGTHQQLLETNEIYRSTYLSQNRTEDQLAVQ